METYTVTISFQLKADSKDAARQIVDAALIGKPVSGPEPTDVVIRVEKSAR